MTAPVEDRRLRPLPMLASWFAARHSADQDAVADNLALALFPLWRIMQFRDLDASTALWLPAALPRVETAFLQSQRLSAVFNANVRAAELAVELPLAFDLPTVEVPQNTSPGSFDLPPGVNLEQAAAPVVQTDVQADVQAVAPNALDAQRVAEQIARGRQLGTPQWVLDQIQRMADVRAGRETQPRVELQQFDRADVATTLSIEANYRTKRAMPGPEVQLMQDALVRSSGGAIREALNGGRGVTDRVMRKDRKVIGFARVTDSDPCALCALLASRGAVYGKGSFIVSDRKWEPNEQAARDVPDGWTNVAKVHDNCRCQMRPVYSKSSSWDAIAKHYLNLWKQVEVNENDLLDAKRRHPNYDPRKRRHAAQMKKYRELVKNNKPPGNQFDLNMMRRDLQERKGGLLDSGFGQTDPQVAFVDRTLVLLDQ